MYEVYSLALRANIAVKFSKMEHGKEVKKEAEILDQIKNCPNVVQKLYHYSYAQDIYAPPPLNTERPYLWAFDRSRIAIAMKIEAPNLFKHVKDKTFGPFGFPLSHVQKIAKDLLTTFYALTHEKLIYGDCKPENICYDHKRLKTTLIDFSHSIKEGTQHKIIQDIFQTINYRAPEVTLGHPFDSTVDLWSLGTTLYEIYTNTFIGWDSKQTPQQQRFDVLHQIFAITGLPSIDYLDRSRYASKYFGLDANKKPYLLKPPSEAIQKLLTLPRGKSSSKR